MEKKEGKQKNIYLIGFMGCGKSTVSNYLHEEYKRKQIEMDEEIQREEGMSISQIFEQKGEAYFRALETKLLHRLREEENYVVSCGGGVPMREENVKEMKKNGKVILLLAKPETIYERVKDCHDRPLLEGNMNVEYIKGLMEQRNEKYQAAADVCVHTDEREISEICREIMEYVSGTGNR